VEECRVTVEGELDERTSQTLRQQLVVLVEQGCRQVVVDLRRTVVIESAGLQVLVDAMRAMEELGGALILRAPSREVYELGRVRRLGDLLATVNDAVDEAEAIHRLDQLFY
jgi:anti-sigma B factor antagonist